MIKNSNKDNALIKIKNLKLSLKSKGINRISLESVASIEKHLKAYLNHKIIVMKEKMMIKGKKVLENNEVNEAFSKEEESWEI